MHVKADRIVVVVSRLLSQPRSASCCSVKNSTGVYLRIDDRLHVLSPSEWCVRGQWELVAVPRSSKPWRVATLPTSHHSHLPEGSDSFDSLFQNHNEWSGEDSRKVGGTAQFLSGRKPGCTCILSSHGYQEVKRRCRGQLLCWLAERPTVYYMR